LKKRSLALILVIVLATTITAQAAQARLNHVIPMLSFSGTTANCEADVTANRTSDEIDVTMTLWQGNTPLKSWVTSGTGSVFLSKTYSVEKGKTYTLTVDATINGTAQARQSVSKKS